MIAHDGAGVGEHDSLTNVPGASALFLVGDVHRINPLHFSLDRDIDSESFGAGPLLGDHHGVSPLDFALLRNTHHVRLSPCALLRDHDGEGPLDFTLYGDVNRIGLSPSSLLRDDRAVCWLAFAMCRHMHQSS